MDIQTKVILITGAARRIGAALARHFAAAGARVAIHYHHSRAAAEALLDDIKRQGHDAVLVRGDISQAADVKRLVDEAIDALGGNGIDIVINNAAIFERVPFEQLDEAAWDRQMDVNLKGTYLCALEVARRIQAHDLAGRRAGKIINFACVSGWKPWPDYLAYSVSKAGVIALTKALALELAPAIQVNAIAPGPILPAENEPPEKFERLIQKLPLKRAGTVDEIISAVRFFIENDFVTGQVIAVDGGRSMQ